MVKSYNSAIATSSHELAQKSYEVMTLILAKYSDIDLPAWCDLDLEIKQQMILAHQQYASIYLRELIVEHRLSYLPYPSPRSN